MFILAVDLGRPVYSCPRRDMNVLPCFRHVAKVTKMILIRKNMKKVYIHIFFLDIQQGNY